jgi:hypothetical protein
MARIHAMDALDIFTDTHIDWRRDFFSLRQSEVAALLAWADMRGYRAPKNANGSRARYWHAYLVRTIEAADRQARKG